MNEDTREVELWCLNDEYLYNEVTEIVRRSPFPDEELRDLICSLQSEGLCKDLFNGIDTNNIDWDEIIETFTEDDNE